MVGLAQLVSASGCGPEGRGFESHISPHTEELFCLTDKRVLFFFFRLKNNGFYGKIKAKIFVSFLWVEYEKTTHKHTDIHYAHGVSEYVRILQSAHYLGTREL